MSPCAWENILVICGVVLLGHAANAADAPSLSVIISDIASQPKEAAPVVPEVFGDREEPIALTIATSFEGPAYLRADLFQIAGKLSMPLANDVHLKDVTFAHVLAQNLNFRVKLPDVKSPTEILIRVSLAPAKATDSVLHVADFRYKVYPSSVTQELTDLLQPNPSAPALAVIFGPGQKLREFLTSLHVPFEDAGASTPDRFDSSRLYFCEMNDGEQFQQAQDRSAGVHMAVFSPDSSLPEGVYSERSDSGTFIHVTSPLLDNLNEDPRGQLGLIKIIHLLSITSSSAK